MNIGGALAEARSEAGLTITQVSERTRIRETIIRAIERGDYEACGGDYYARGHIRAIARVVGADPVPLIKEYDVSRLPPPEPAAAGVTGPDGHGGSVSPDPDVTSEQPALWQSARHLVQRVGHPPAADPPYSPPGITAAEAFRPGLPIDFERRRPRRPWLLWLVVLVLAGLVIYLLVSRGSPPSRALAAPTRSHASAAAAAHRANSPSTTTATPAARAVPLAIASAAAFGPAGTSQGDDPQGAALAIDASAATSWRTDWYATAHLGGLQSGTGLLLSLGEAATISSATVTLGAEPGGTIELRAGGTPVLADLPVVATAANPGGTLTMRLNAPVRASYALLWFTSLPPDGAGTYEAYVYNVRLMGDPA